jgi:hypothetical protein
MKVCAVEAELFHADGQTDMMKLIVAFRNFTKARDIFYYSFRVLVMTSLQKLTNM